MVLKNLTNNSVFDTSVSSFWSQLSYKIVQLSVLNPRLTMLRKNMQTDIKNMFENNWKHNDRNIFISLIRYISLISIRFMGEFFKYCTLKLAERKL